MPARYDTVGRQALAGAIAELRERRRLNQRWVATALGVTQGAVSEWIRGISRPTVGNALALHKLFGVPLDAWDRPCPVKCRKHPKQHESARSA